MATSIAHGLVGIVVYAAASAIPARRKRLALGALPLFVAATAANLPDLDMIASLAMFDDHRILHGRGTHSLTFAALVSALVWLIARRDSQGQRYALLAFALVLSHVVVDSMTGPRLGGAHVTGTAPFWPFSDFRVRAPIAIFKGVTHRDILPDALVTASWELVLLGPIAAASVALAKLAPGTRRGAP